ncbi:ubiquinol--cytochrome-c reductase subunit 6 [Spiromyces aspiralis]|uniref:Ubiquinol--cytochrome-c reductase subunit 6 n=1 Tax=Spiromyces aspiralis TaxID=68401 RepID=A0ACC1HX34_9FUNG|nr:ubiquinol--cytochrome-c reductase subunit 6 [Spiromyces aspiralis]
MALLEWFSASNFFGTVHAEENSDEQQLVAAETPVSGAESQPEEKEVEAGEEEEEEVEAGEGEEAEEEEEEEDEEEEGEEEEPEDQAPRFREACGQTPTCLPLKHHLDACAKRVEEGSSERCAEEFLHFVHCVDHCAAPKIFAHLK